MKNFKGIAVHHLPGIEGLWPVCHIHPPLFVLHMPVI